MQKHISIQDINPYLICTICSGYLVDATTLVECLHSFCRSCLIKYLESSYNCPKCNTEIHKTKPLEYIRSDSTLQELVNKLVPGLFNDEEKRRKEWDLENKENLNNSHSSDDLNSRIPVTLKYFRGTSRMERLKAEHILSLFPTRYLCCQSEMPIRVLKKFIMAKFDIDPGYFELDVWRGDETLLDDLTLKDIVQIYGLYRERKALELRFSFYPIYTKEELASETSKDVEMKNENYKAEVDNTNERKNDTDRINTKKSQSSINSQTDTHNIKSDSNSETNIQTNNERVEPQVESNVVSKEVEKNDLPVVNLVSSHEDETVASEHNMEMQREDNAPETYSTSNKNILESSSTHEENVLGTSAENTSMEIQ